MGLDALQFFHQPDRVVPKAGDFSTADFQYRTHVKKYRSSVRDLTFLICHSNLYKKAVFKHSVTNWHDAINKKRMT